MELFSNKYYRLELSDDQKVIEFHWEDDHTNMTYEDFVEACCNFVGYGFEYQTKLLLIDTHNFKLDLPEQFFQWQKEVHYLRYKKLGVIKVAYIMPAASMSHVQNDEGEEGSHTTYYFDNGSSAMNWLKE